MRIGNQVLLGEAIRDLEKRQKSRQTRASRDALDLALIDLATYFRDALLVANGVTISSSYIREQLAAGDVAAAARALGRPHRVEGVVVRGHMRGRGLGFPTANLETAPHTATPADGVYAGWLTSLDLDGAETARWPAAISVGTNPTFGIGDRTVEAYALDRDDLDLYGVHAAIDFTARLRGTERFDSVEALITQMREDVIQARALTAG